MDLLDTYTEGKNMKDWKSEVERAAEGVRHRVLQHVVANGGGYLSQACSSAEILTTLYLRVMEIGSSDAPMTPGPFMGVPSAKNPDFRSGAEYNGPKRPEYDRFVLSPSHYALVHYATLVEVGRLDSKALALFNMDGQTLDMIASEYSPGSEVMGGSLGQALSQASGIAYARKLKGESGRVWVFMSDGEFQEGQTWEAFQASSHQGLDNLGAYVDVNGQQVDGPTDEVMTIEPLASRLEAFGVKPVTVDGHDPDALAAAAEVDREGKPLVVLAYTDPCRGIPLLEERRPLLHYLRFKSTEEETQYTEYLESWSGEGR